MRWGTAVVAVIVTAGLAGCSGTPPTPSPSPTPSAALSADAAFAIPLWCGGDKAYDAVFRDIDDQDLAAVHADSTKALAVFTAMAAAERAHHWNAKVQPYLTRYLAEDDAAVSYYRTLEHVRSVDEAIDVTNPNDEQLNAAVAVAAGVPSTSTCS